MNKTANNIEVAVAQFGDLRWRLNNLYWITDKGGSEIPFRLNWAQERFIDEVWYQNLILKARQLGFTTFVQLVMLDACIFNSNVRAGTIAHTQDDARIIFRDKVKYPYERLPEALRAAVTTEADSASELLFSNNSSIRVGTSLRSGTLQYLHISEYGKICAKYPEKAREVRTGALNTVQAGNFVFVESTAEGQEGHFFELCEAAQEQARRRLTPTPLDFKFHFYPWWQEPGYALDPEGVEISGPLERYFDDLARIHHIELTPAQRAWYATKHKTQGADMKREYPATPAEAFAAAVQGAYFGDLMAQADEEGRIGKEPWNPKYPVHTAWDLGLDDCTAIWFFQREGQAWRFIDFYQASGKALPHYAKELDRRPYRYGDCILPHDGNARDLGTGLTRAQTLQNNGVKRVRVMDLRGKGTSINGSRLVLPMSYFDAERCAEGLQALRSYRREWDDKLGTWRDEPRHDWASHPADAYAEAAAADPQNDEWSGAALKYDDVTA